MSYWAKLDSGDKVTVISAIVTIIVWWHYKGKHKV